MTMNMTHKYAKFLILIPLAILLVYGLSLKTLIQRVDATIVQNRWEEKIAQANLIGDQYDMYAQRDQDWGTYDYLSDIDPLVSNVDSEPGMFAALYDNSLNVISSRVTCFNEIEQDPLHDADLMQAVTSKESGMTTVNWILADGKTAPAMLYFRWIPSNPELDNRMLLMVSMYAGELKASPHSVLVAWCFGLLMTTGLVSILSIMMVMHSNRR